MKSGWKFASVFLLLGIPLFAQAPVAKFEPPRLKNGRPNFQGLWFRPARPAPNSANPSGNIDRNFGGMEYLPAALPRKKFLAERLGNDLLYFWCTSAGVPTAILFTPFPWQIVQDDNHVIFLHEHGHDWRIIHTDGSAHPPKNELHGFMGDSRGRWEGDTLVVDVANFQKGDRRMNFLGDFLDENSHLVERFTLVDADTIRYEVTVEDPTVLAKPWSTQMLTVRQGKDDRLLDLACREGERDVEKLKESPQYLPSSKGESATKGGNKK